MFGIKDDVVNELRQICDDKIATGDDLNINELIEIKLHSTDPEIRSNYSNIKCLHDTILSIFRQRYSHYVKINSRWHKDRYFLKIIFFFDRYIFLKFVNKHRAKLYVDRYFEGDINEEKLIYIAGLFIYLFYNHPSLI